MVWRRRFKGGEPSSNTRRSPLEYPLWGCSSTHSLVRKKLNTPYTMITRFWHPFDSWSSWQLFFFLPSNFCQQEEEAEGRAAVFAGASGSLCCQGWVPSSTLGGFFSPPFSHSLSLIWILLPCWKRSVIIQRISLASHIPAIIIQTGKCWEGVVGYLGMERGGECAFGLAAPF